MHGSRLQKQGIAMRPRLVDSSQAVVGAWYIRIGEREKGEVLLAQALQRRRNSPWYYVRAAESLLGVSAGR
jgi:hypothetical protein